MRKGVERNRSGETEKVFHLLVHYPDTYSRWIGKGPNRRPHILSRSPTQVAKIQVLNQQFAASRDIHPLKIGSKADKEAKQSQALYYSSYCSNFLLPTESKNINILNSFGYIFSCMINNFPNRCMYYLSVHCQDLLGS